MDKDSVRAKFHAYMDKIGDAVAGGKIAKPYEVDTYTTSAPNDSTMTIGATSTRRDIPHETRKFHINWSKGYCSMQINSEYRRNVSPQDVYSAIEDILSKIIQAD